VMKYIRQSRPRTMPVGRKILLMRIPQKTLLRRL
jgi:hypothetical protein